MEQVIADVKNSAFTHAPSGYFQANADWITLHLPEHRPWQGDFMQLITVLHTPPPAA
ncbi:hypothetical protein [Streptomyces sp. NPDC048527]|uniref:hypothetical protein n=1 Tax=Streptomyces sp. NPDC048527 TaxID=3365568 RepID=UPI0037200C9D